MKRAVVVLCALGVLAGCGGSGEDQPKALPPVMATGMSSSPSAAVPSSRPDPAVSPGGVATPRTSDIPLELSAETAEQFARKWIEAVNVAYATMEPHPIAELSDPTCVGCQMAIDQLKKAASSGKRYRGGRITVRDTAAPAAEQGSTAVTVVYSVARQEVLDAAGMVQKTLPPDDKVVISLTLKKSRGSWTVTEATR